MWRNMMIALLIATVVAILGCGSGSLMLSPSSPPPPPNISISLNTALAGSPDLTLTLLGQHFLGETDNFSQAMLLANSSITPLATTFVSSTQLTAVIPSVLLSNALTAELFVQTGNPLGDLPLSKSNAVNFKVISAPNLDLAHGSNDFRNRRKHHENRAPST